MPFFNGANRADIPSGTLMLFQQTAAPTGWVKQTTHDNKALRVVSGTAGSGGSAAFTTAFASQTPSGSVSVAGLSAAATTLSTSQIASHAHDVGNIGRNDLYPPSIGTYQEFAISGCVPFTFRNNTVSTTGGGGSHSHSVSGSASFSGNAINLAVQYVDLIIASKS